MPICGHNLPPLIKIGVNFGTSSGGPALIIQITQRGGGAAGANALIYQPGVVDYAHYISTCPLRFSDLPLSLFLCNCMSFLWHVALYVFEWISILGCTAVYCLRTSIEKYSKKA